MIQNMAKHLDVKNDYLYIKGREDEKIGFVERLLSKTQHTLDQIADIAGVSLDFVKTVKLQLTDK